MHKMYFVHNVFCTNVFRILYIRYYLYQKILLISFQTVTGEDVTQEELGGAKVHTSKSGKYWVIAYR